MDVNVWIIAFATVAGPILAVQAQKALERILERRRRKQSLFETLMATRANRVSTQHVEALNMIDLTFDGTHPFGIRRLRKRTSERERAVLAKWRIYLSHLDDVPGENATEAARLLWGSGTDSKFLDVLEAIAGDVGYAFDRVQVAKGFYSPKAHGDQFLQDYAVRQWLYEIATNKRPLNVLAVVREAPQQKPPSPAISGEANPPQRVERSDRPEAT